MIDPEIGRAQQLLQTDRTDEARLFLEQLVAADPANAMAQLLLGVALYGQGDSAGAVEAYHRTINLGMNDAVVYNNLGSALNQQGQYAAAILAFQEAIARKSNYAEPRFNLAVTFQILGRHLEASKLYRTALDLEPNRAEAYCALASSLKELGHLEDAVSAYRRAIDLAPEFSDAYLGLADTLSLTTCHIDAVAAYEQSLRLGGSNFATANNNLAATLMVLKRPAEAIECYRKVIEGDPDCADSNFNFARALISLGRQSEALRYLEKAIAVRPDFADAYCALGGVLGGLKKHDEALAACQKAIALTHRPNYAEPYFHLANALAARKRHDEAIQAYEMSIALNPDYPEAFGKLGDVLFRLKRYPEAIAAYETAVGLEPEFPFAPGMIFHCKMLMHDWEGIDERARELLRGVEAAKPVSSPFILFSMPSSQAQQKLCAEIYTREKYLATSTLSALPHRPTADKRIRIGYFSADFYDHPVSRLTAELFEQHDRSRFEIIAFSYGSPPLDVMRRRLVAAFDTFLDVRESSDEEIAALAREMEIDVAVDLTGFTGEMRSRIFALRAAPAQVSYLGYLGTMGASYIDYLIADTVVIPLEDQSYYSEEVVYLPNCFMVNGAHRHIAERRVARCDVGLPEDGFVFCCFNASYKITPQVFAIWMEILRKTDQTTLWLVESDKGATQRLRQEAMERGIDPHRIIFANRMDLPTYLACYKLADLFLDTLYYGAGTTGSDALWAGLPIVTHLGDTYTGRIAASLLNAIGLPDLIARSPEEYASIAIELACNPTRLSELKLRLDRNRSTFPLFNAELFTRQFEEAIIQICSNHQDITDNA